MRSSEVLQQVIEFFCWLDNQTNHTEKNVYDLIKNLEISFFFSPSSILLVLKQAKKKPNEINKSNCNSPWSRIDG